MKGLILKDLLSLRKTLGFLAVYMVIFPALIFQGGGADFAALIVLVFASTAGMGLYSTDESAHAYPYIRALPVSPRQIVTARYATQLGIDLVGVMIGLAITLITHGAVAEFLMSALVMVMLLVCLSAPLMYRFDSSRGRLAMLAVTSGAIAVGFVLAKTVFSGAAIEWTAIDAFIDGHLLGMFALTLVLFALILAISWTLSCQIVRKKEA